MNNVLSQSQYANAVECLGAQAAEFLEYMPPSLTREAQELRLRCGAPPMLTVAGRQICPDADRRLPAELLEDMLFNLCERSVYSRQDDIAHGFVTVGAGHRAGLGGTAVYSDGQITSLRDISSINLRIARAVSGCANGLVARLFADGQTGALIAGAPCSGKTTLLRDLADALASGRGSMARKVTVIDERGELAGMKDGESVFGLERCDVLSGFGKADGLWHAVRCLSPDVVICDELGGERELDGIVSCVNAGVCVVASIHAGSAAELAARPQVRRLAHTGAFSQAVLLEGAKRPGHLCEIIPISSLL